MTCVRVTRVRSRPVFASTTWTSLPSRTNPAISSRFTYLLPDESYSLRLPYFLMTTEACFMGTTLSMLLCTHDKYILTQSASNRIVQSMLQCSKSGGVKMPTTVKSGSSRTHSNESSFVSLLSGWAQQGVQSFFATQRILLDLAMRQNASLMHSLRQQLSDPHHSPTAILTEVTAEGIANFIEGQKILLELGQEQNELLMTGMKERVGDWPAAEAITDLLRRSLETFIGMQQEILKTAGKQTHDRKSTRLN